MNKKLKILVGSIIITGVIGTTSFVIIDPYNMFGKKSVKIPEKESNFVENKKDEKNSTEKKENIKLDLKGIKDGEYIGVSKGYGGDIKVKVIIENSKIKNIEVISHSETPKYYENGSKVIANILKENSVDVDAISGATMTSNGIKNAVKDALSKAGFEIPKNNESKSNNEVSNLKNSKNLNGSKNFDLKEYNFKDGEYIGESIGFKGNVKVKVIIKEGKLSNIKVISHNDDSEFFNKAKGIIIKILSNQGTVGVDTISGATYSSRGILNAVNEALNKTIKENSVINNKINFIKKNNYEENNSYKKDNIIPIYIKDIVKNIENSNKSINNNIVSKKYKFKEGNYIGESNGFKGTIKVKIIVKEGTLVNIDILEHNDDDAFFNNAKKIILKILQNQGTNGVDTVSGATYSSRGILNAVNIALNKADSGNDVVSNNTINNKPQDENKEVLSENKEDSGNDVVSNNTISNKPQGENKEVLSDKEIKYLDGNYIGNGLGWTGRPINVEVTFENNKISSINIKEYGDDGGGFRTKANGVIFKLLDDQATKTINDLLLHEELTKEIFKSEDYYKKGRELIGDYANELKNEPKYTGPIGEIYTESESFGKITKVVKKYIEEHNKTSIFDTVSGATYSAKGIAKAVKDAMEKSASAFNNKNIVNDLKIINLKNKTMKVDKQKKLDISNLKVILSTRDGKQKEIAYDKFKENNIEIYDRKTGNHIFNGMDLSNYKEGQGIYAIVKHKKSLYKDTFLIIPEEVVYNNNFVTDMEYSINNGATWEKINNMEMYGENINFAQILNIPNDYKDKKVLLRLVSNKRNTYLLEPEDVGEILKADNKEYFLTASKKDKASNVNIPSTIRVKFNFIGDSNSDNNLGKNNFEKISSVQISTNGAKINDVNGLRLKVGDVFDWTGVKFRFLDENKMQIINLFTDDELNKGLKDKERTKKVGYFYYEDLEKLGMKISPKQGTIVTESMFPAGKTSMIFDKFTLEYKGKVFEIKYNSDKKEFYMLLKKEDSAMVKVKDGDTNKVKSTEKKVDPVVDGKDTVKKETDNKDKGTTIKLKKSHDYNVPNIKNGWKIGMHGLKQFDQTDIKQITGYNLEYGNYREKATSTFKALYCAWAQGDMSESSIKKLLVGKYVENGYKITGVEFNVGIEPKQYAKEHGDLYPTKYAKEHGMIKSYSADKQYNIHDILSRPKETKYMKMTVLMNK